MLFGLCIPHMYIHYNVELIFFVGDFCTCVLNESIIFFSYAFWFGIKIMAASFKKLGNLPSYISLWKSCLKLELLAPWICRERTSGAIWARIFFLGKKKIHTHTNICKLYRKIYCFLFWCTVLWILTTSYKLLNVIFLSFSSKYVFIFSMVSLLTWEINFSYTCFLGIFMGNIMCLSLLYICHFLCSSYISDLLSKISFLMPKLHLLVRAYW